MSEPIPAKAMPEFVAHMDAHDFGDLSEGAWFAVLEEAAREFMKSRGICGDHTSAVHQYLGSDMDGEVGP